MDELELQKLMLAWFILIVGRLAQLMSSSCNRLAPQYTVAPPASVTVPMAVPPPRLTPPRRVSFSPTTTVNPVTPFWMRQEAVLNEAIIPIVEAEDMHPGFVKLVCQSADEAGILVARYRQLIQLSGDSDHSIKHRSLCPFFSMRQDYHEALPVPSQIEQFKQIISIYNEDIKLCLAKAAYPGLMTLICATVEAMDVIMTRLKRSMLYMIKQEDAILRTDFWELMRKQLGLESWRVCLASPKRLNHLFKRDRALLVISTRFVEDIMKIVVVTRPDEGFFLEITSKWDESLCLSVDAPVVVEPASGAGAPAAAGAGSSTDPVFAPLVVPAASRALGAYFFKEPFPIENMMSSLRLG